MVQYLPDPLGFGPGRSPISKALDKGTFITGVFGEDSFNVKKSRCLVTLCVKVAIGKWIKCRWWVFKGSLGLRVACNNTTQRSYI